jgi:hypothetical protein
VALFVVFLAMTAVGWLWVPRENSHSAARRAARWTATISVFLPALSLMLINIGLGRALAGALPAIVGPSEEAPPPAGLRESIIGTENALDRARHLPITPPWWGRFFLLNGSKLHQWSEIAEEKRNQGYDPTRSASEAIIMLVENSSRYLPRGLLLLGAGVIVALWGLLPAILSETRLGMRAITGLTPADRRTASQRYGRDTDKVFRFLRHVGNLMLAAVCLSAILMLATLVPAWEKPVTRLLVGPPWEEGLIPPLAHLLGLAVLGLVISRGWFRPLALGFRSALDVGLDAVNWLRSSPRNATPRACIVTRLTAMLHHIQRWKDSTTGRGYDALVILAHSQGSMIAVETLRFWKRRAALDEPRGADRSQPLDRYFRAGAGALPISLFTMGNPLRQLYFQRFPHLYYWADKPEHRASSRSSDAAGEHQRLESRDDRNAPETRGPDLDEAGLYRWWNAYRSADYVGRNVWSCPESPTAGADRECTFEPAEHPPSATDRTADFCLGAGAHLRYWDETAPPVSQSLDRLVATA